MEPPEATAHIWEWYLALSAGLGDMGGFHTEILAFAFLTDARPDAWEVSMLRMIYRVHMAASEKKRQGKGGAQASVEVEARDGAGVAGLLRGMGAKKG